MTRSKKTGAALWTIQGLLAALFLFAGVTKFILPAQVLQQGPVVLPLTFIHFIGVCEILGAVGLILPTLLRIRPILTPLAAIGLVIIMIGAVSVTVLGGPVAPALFPLVVGILAATVAYGRWQLLAR
jgi:uncharacterized membrane protein